MWARVTRASRSPNARAISKHRCARRRYSSALLATIPLPIDDKRPRIGSVCWRRSWVGRAAPTCASAGPRTGVLRWPTMQRRCVAQGAHVASPMVGGRLRRAGQRHTLVNALGRTSYSPTQGPPEGFGTPLSRRPNPMPWAGFSLPIAGAGLPSLILGSGGRLAAQPS